MNGNTNALESGRELPTGLIAGRVSALSLLIISVICAASCHGVDIYCDRSGIMAPSCASTVVPGVRIPNVDGYEVKAARDDGDGGGVHNVSIYYASTHEKQLGIVISAHPTESSVLNLVGPTEEVNGHLVYTAGSGDDTYSATTIVEGISYDIDTIHLPGGDPNSLASARDAFVAALTRR